MMAKQSYKEFLQEYYKYFNSFSEVIDHYDDKDDQPTELDVKDDDFAAPGEEVNTKKRRKVRHKAGDKESLNPTRFRQ